MFAVRKFIFESVWIFIQLFYWIISKEFPSQPHDNSIQQDSCHANLSINKSHIILILHIHKLHINSDIQVYFSKKHITCYSNHFFLSPPKHLLSMYENSCHFHAKTFTSLTHCLRIIMIIVNFIFMKMTITVCKAPLYIYSHSFSLLLLSGMHTTASEICW